MGGAELACVLYNTHLVTLNGCWVQIILILKAEDNKSLWWTLSINKKINALILPTCCQCPSVPTVAALSGCCLSFHMLQLNTKKCERSHSSQRAEQQRIFEQKHAKLPIWMKFYTWMTPQQQDGVILTISEDVAHDYTGYTEFARFFYARPPKWFVYTGNSAEPNDRAFTWEFQQLILKQCQWWMHIK